MRDRTTSDEHYIIDLCDEVLGSPAVRQATFPWLVGDPNAKGYCKPLPVDAFWPELDLVVEYLEKQHSLGDQPPRPSGRDTISGVKRSVQRWLYDQRGREALASHGLRLVELHWTEFAAVEHGRERGHLVRDRAHDLAVLRARLLDHS